MKQKEFFYILLLLVVSIFLLSGCASQQQPNIPAPVKENGGQLPLNPPPLKQQQLNQDNELLRHHTYITFSSDGKSWKNGDLVRKSASVPDLIQLTKDVSKFKKGDLLVYFVDPTVMKGPGTEGLGIIHSSDLGKSWQETGHVTLSGKKNKGGAVDPSVVQLADGSLRLYYFGSEVTSGDPALGPPGGGTNKVYSAKSTDGVNFIVEEGTRWEDNRLTDPEVIYFNGKWLMYYSVGPESKLSTSADGLNFTGVKIAGGNVGGVPGALATDSEVRLFGCSKGISTAISSDGINFKPEQADILNIKEEVCDPAVTKLSDGRYAMIYKVIEGQQQQLPEMQTQQGQKIPSDKCPDSICDEFEIKEGICKEDCQNVAGWKESKIQAPQQAQPQQPIFQSNEISVKATGAKYSTVPTKPTGWFKTGQEANIMLFGIDFNNAGGPLLFNHPGEIATDGSHLFLADRNNNRVLVWNKIPSGNTPPDLVLGQKDFNTNNPGTGSGQMNWPVGISVANGKVVVADTYNERILIWNSIPIKNAQPADLILESRKSYPNSLDIKWPWGVWTDGQKLAVSSTQAAKVLIWNTFPARSDQPPDVVLTAEGKMGTPRGITSNGEYLIVADHNAKIDTQNTNGPGGTSATFVWKNWPASDKTMDFTFQGWRTGTFLPDNSLMLLSTTHFPPSIWNEPPTSAEDEPDLQLVQVQGLSSQSLQTGDGSGIAWADNRLYLSLSNGNKILVYNFMPKESTQKADFAIGAPDIETNTLETNFFLTNPAVATDGKSLFASSDFERRMYVWKSLPDQSNAHPDFVYRFPEGPWDNALWGDTLVLAGKKTVYLWNKLPLNGELPDVTFTDKIGTVMFEDLAGVALDDKFFYLADKEKIYVWDGIPKADSEPKFTFSGTGFGRLDSDGKYLVGIVNGRDVALWGIDKLSAESKPSLVPSGSLDSNVLIRFNLPGSAIAKDNHLFVADTGFGRVLVWTKLEDALAGKAADIVLGADNLQDTTQEVGRNKLFWPATLAFDGSYLWIGEFKFSGRLLRYSVG